jgi:hypothetical protein
MEKNEIIGHLTVEDFPLDPDFTWQIQFDPKLTPLQATLKNVTNHLRKEVNRRSGFSVVFSTRQTDQYYQQAVYYLLHPKHGSLPLFMVPLGPGSDGFMRYEIVFN